MSSKEDISSKIKELNFKKGSFSERTSSLLLNDEFDVPLNSQQFVSLYNDGPGKNIKVVHLTALMQPLLREGIIKTKISKKGKQKIKLWIPGWIDKKEILPDSYSKQVLINLHPEILKTSEKLFKNKHYPEAIFNAYRKVEILVKNKSGIHNLTPHPLMQKVFSVNSPLLKFNDLKTQTDRDEQQGLMELFAGAMLGIRNPKAHSDIVQLDKIRTLEYLSFASLLCKRLDETTKV